MTMKIPKICFITGSRAEFGILSPIMRRISETVGKDSIQIIATNMHLSPRYGMTVKEIEAEGFAVNAKVEMLLDADTPSATVKSMGIESIGIADSLERLKPDVAVILGDRYEMLAAASAALIFRVPIIHLHGGETTLGAYDNAIRHAITQLSSVHLTSTEEYRDKVIAMGMDPATVFCIGSPAADTISQFTPLPLDEIEESIGFKLGERFLVATFHPVTLQHGDEERQTKEFLSALDLLAPDIRLLFTLPNSDTGGETVRRMIQQWCADRPEKALAVASLGARRYYSAVAHSSGVVGNSSSGLIEAPSLGVPTLNIGDRQKGRARGESVIDCECDAEAISRGLKRLMSDQMREIALRRPNPYFKPGTINRAAGIIIETAKSL